MLIHKLDKVVLPAKPCRVCRHVEPWYLRVQQRVRCGAKRAKLAADTWKSGKVNCQKCLKLKGIAPKEHS